MLHTLWQSKKGKLKSKPRFHDIKTYLEDRTFPPDAMATDRKSIQRLAAQFFVSAGRLSKKPSNHILKVDAEEVKDVHEGACGPHMSGHMLAKKILPTAFYWIGQQ